MAPPTRVRLSAAERTALETAGPNMSAALRGYLLVGMCAAGVDMGPHTRELRKLLLAELPAPLLAAIEGVLGECRTSVGQVSYVLPAEPPAEQAPEEPADPFAGVGFEV